jgi:hypothetical protein
MIKKGRAFMRAAILTAATMLIAGCPLVSDYPLSDPKAAKIDEELRGSWESRDGESGEARRMRFVPFDEHELVAIATGDPGGEIAALRAFTTEVEGQRFMNVRELDKGASGWYLLRYRVEGGKLLMTLVDDGLFEGRTFEGPAGLLEYLRRNISDPRLYAPQSGGGSQDMAWERVPETSR